MSSRKRYSDSANAAIAPNTMHEGQRNDRHDQAVLEIEREIAAREHRLVADQAEGVGVGRTQRRAEDRGSRLERIIAMRRTGASAITV